MCWGKAFAFVTIGNEKLWIPSKLIKLLFDLDDLLKILAAKIEEKLRTTKNVMCVLIPLHGNSSETG